MSNLEIILENLNEMDFLQAQENVEVMKNSDVIDVHVPMIAYDDLV